MALSPETQKIAELLSTSLQEGDEENKSVGSLFFSAGEEEESSEGEADSTILLQQPVEDSLAVLPAKSKMSDMEQMKELIKQTLEGQAEERRREREADQVERD